MSCSSTTPVCQPVEEKAAFLTPSTILGGSREVKRALMKSRPYLEKQITQYMQLFNKRYEVSHPTLGAEILFRAIIQHCAEKARLTGIIYTCTP